MEKEIRVLMVEDDPFFSQLCLRALEEAGFDITLAPDGERGLEKFEEMKPDLVLLDIILPKMNGFEVLEKIRKNSDQMLANTPVIILSNLYAKEEEKKGKELRANDYLIKANTSSQELISKINSVLGKKS